MSHFTILPATDADVQELIHVLQMTLGKTAMYAAMMPYDTDGSIQRMMHEGRIRGALRDPAVRLFKMVVSRRVDTEVTGPDEGEGECAGENESRDTLCGCVALKLDEGRVVKSSSDGSVRTEAGDAIRSITSLPGGNEDALRAILEGVARLYDGMSGRHYGIEMLGVLPAYQNQGLATRLMEHCLRITDSESPSLPTWLTALPGANSVYTRHGFVGVDEDVVDLNAYDPTGRHLGSFAHRSMRRPPKQPAGEKA
ncbi:hypothetical protein BD324DRAFT_639934 [Kockovaella imperatae]|uniref:N-acetyltransferase domain-containing protein n=1 Tax=Kockovaella imperatae TaxID=4999 RepID=A0A1Y1U5S9_9TREE|nr:hypothetical protein BD324DRAFT_639934 [Kockovaella imperatae]ORX33390.1 hypothetical protein BD324DRAFT_639934 [Kockovaella imperatae]